MPTYQPIRNWRAHLHTRMLAPAPAQRLVPETCARARSCTSLGQKLASQPARNLHACLGPRVTRPETGAHACAHTLANQTCARARTSPDQKLASAPTPTCQPTRNLPACPRPRAGQPETHTPVPTSAHHPTKNSRGGATSSSAPTPAPTPCSNVLVTQLCLAT